jgi:O-antigen/teichoic acid export membrane protein
VPSAQPADRPSLFRSLLLTGGGNVVILAVNLVTGVLVARLLGPEGRGEVAVLLALAQIVGWLGTLGMNEGVTYVAAKGTTERARLVGTALVLALGLGALGVLLAQLLLPLVLSEQSSELLIQGRVYSLSIVLGVASSLLLGVLAGDQDFVALTVLRVAQPVSYLAVLVLLAAAGGLTTTDVLLSTAVSMALVLGLAGWRLRASTGIGRPSAALARQAARFGVKVQGSLLGSLGTARLDLLLMPTFVTTAAIGLYSVATNVAYMVVSLVGAVSLVAFPAAARRGSAAGTVLVTKLLRLVILAGVALVLPLGLAAPQLIGLVYGSDFVEASTALRLLLPGMVLALATGVLDSGLQAVGRPLAASAGQLLGLVVTLVGLTLTLSPLGIEGAAATTSCAYLATFCFGAWQLRRGGEFSLRALADARALRDDLVMLVARVRRRAA